MSSDLADTRHAVLRAEADAMAADLISLRRHLHAVPEVGLQLPVTQRIVVESLVGLGLELTTGRELSSVVVVIRGAAPGPAVLLRGDMDALPLVEQTGLDFAPAPGSAHHGAMHACGHDLHTAGLVGAARLLAAHRDDLAGDVVLMFQPGEEACDGAGQMLAEGVLDAAGRRVVAAYGLHVSSYGQPAGMVASRPGPLMASAARLVVRVVGAGGHGSTPHRSQDPIPVACEIVTALQTLVTRTFDIFDPVVVTVGSVRAGTACNIIPDEALIEGTVRCFSRESEERASTAIARLSEGIAQAHGLCADVSCDVEYPVTYNDPDEYEFAVSVVRDVLGTERYTTLPTPLTGAEDFSRVLDQVPGAYLFLGATTQDPDTAPTNHSPLATFDDAVLPDASLLLAELAMRRLAAS